ncbi:DUF4974 domain-containing protein [Ralstonia sp. TCR112]|nr:DUF4974 domain-containing protein [Ralstonia sp. TCR112]
MVERMKAAPEPNTTTLKISHTLRREAHAWVRRLTSGDATVADAQALKRWCETSDAHAVAFVEARRLWKDFGPAGEAVRRRQAAQATNMQRATTFGRRAFLGGAFATAAGAAVAVVAPAGLWGAFPALAADFRTKTGEQRQLALAADVTVDLNTHTSVALRRDATANALQGVELLDGEIAVNTTRAAAQPFIVAAGPGRAEATQANFEVRNLDTRVCVTCLSGDVRVDANGRSVMLTANQQVTYGKHAMSAVMAADAATTSAWRSGVLVFRQTPLSDVVDEINRYRPGHVLVVDSKLERSRLNGRFRIDKLDTVFAQMREVLGAKVTELPGGIVLLG